MRISDWSSDVCSSDLMGSGIAEVAAKAGAEVILRSRKQESADAMVAALERSLAKQVERGKLDEAAAKEIGGRVSATHDLHDLKDCDLVLESVVEDLEVKKRSEEHTSELQSLMRISYAVFCWKKTIKNQD